jgi:hypothetical protein
MFFGSDPFQHHFGGGGGGGGRRGRQADPDVDTTKLYEILGVSEKRRTIPSILELLIVR